MNRVVINLEALQHNLATVARWLRSYGASMSVVTKALSGHEACIRALYAMGVRSAADTRVANLRQLKNHMPDAERWMIRPPHLSIVEDIVDLAHVSLVTELKTLRALDVAARQRQRKHKIVLMIELGDLREGVVLGQLTEIYCAALALEHLDVVGIGSQMGCLSGATPNADQVAQLLLFKELLELKYKHALPCLSIGSSVFLPLLCQQRLPAGISHFRIGEALFLGSDLVDGGLLPELRDDVVTLEAEICEIKEKSLIPLGDTSAHTPFTKIDPAIDGTRALTRGYRALLSLGQLDTEVSALRPVDSSFSIAGASSDIMVLNLGSEHQGLDVGDHVSFRCDYAAFVRLMVGRYIPVEVTPSLDSFTDAMQKVDMTSIPPVCPAR